MHEIAVITEDQFERAIPARLRARRAHGEITYGRDIVALRQFIGMSQADFARAMEISVHTLRNRDQGRRNPEGPALALLKIAARHPRIIRENLDSAS